MTTGRINQVTVRRARGAPEALRAHTRRPSTRGHAERTSPSKARVRHLFPFHRLQTAQRQANPPYHWGACPARAAQRPSPPVSQAPATFPRSSGPESGTSMKTAGKRPPARTKKRTHGFRDAADPQKANCRIDLANGNQPTSVTTARRGPLQLGAFCRAPIAGYAVGARTRTSHSRKPGAPSSTEQVHPARQAHQPLGHGHTSLPPLFRNHRSGRTDRKRRPTRRQAPPSHPGAVSVAPPRGGA